VPGGGAIIDVCVVGSLNMDLVVKTPRLPDVGETVTGGVFDTFPGGKGANQAIAAARLGARVAMVGCVGADAFGERQLAGLRAEGIDVTHVRVDPGAATGVAFITVDAAGKNTIVVAPGANAQVRPEHVEAAAALIASARVLLLQLEVPLDAVMRAARIGRAGGATVCLDPAPAAPLPDEVYPLLDVIDPNETEARVLTGLPVATIPETERAAETLVKRGARAAVVKLGERGAFYLSPDGRAHVPAIRVNVVDTTAAGDAFAAALGVALGEGKTLSDAVRFATRVAALKVTRMGAQSLPTRAEVDAAAGGDAQGSRSPL
jgi:ribokinase